MTDTKPPEKITLSVMTCRAHGFMSIQIGDQRVTPNKCCGQWGLARQWDVPREDVIRAAEEAEEAT